MSVPLARFLLLTSGRRREARMYLECEIRGERYVLFAVEGVERWPVLLPGARPEAPDIGMSRDDALRAAVLAGFSPTQAESAMRNAESAPGSGGETRLRRKRGKA